MTKKRHILHCVPLQYQPWLPVGITVTYTLSNGDRVLATAISVSECGQHMSIEYDAEGHCVSQPPVLQKPPRLSGNHPEPLEINSNHPQGTKK